MVLSSIDDIDQQGVSPYLGDYQAGIRFNPLGDGRGVDRGTAPRSERVEARMEL
jgi:hypothetical protein